MRETAVVVSVVMPVYNEEREMEACLLSLQQQTYPQTAMEWIFVDGGSTDATKTLLSRWAEADSTRCVTVLSNPKKIVPCAMNIGIAHARGRYIVRLDAHARYAPDYIERCVFYLEQGIADNVGGVLKTEADGAVGKAIAKVLSSPFGVGNAAFRTGAKSGYVDTVPFGAFRRELFEQLGGYDERLVRNQDNELNDRIRQNGGRIYLSPDICAIYRCRDSVRGLVTMAAQNGRWNILTRHLCPGAMGWRHFVPLGFVLALLILSGLGFVWAGFWWLLFGGLALYTGLAAYAALRTANSVSEGLRMIGLFFVFHVAYGCGSLRGIAQCGTKRY